MKNKRLIQRGDFMLLEQEKELERLKKRLDDLRVSL